MNEATERQPTCAERVEQAWQSRRDDLSAMLDPKPENLTLESHAPKGVEIIFNGDYRIEWASHDEIREYAERVIDPSALADFPDDPADRSQWPAEMLAGVLSEIFDEYTDLIHEMAREAFAEYGLAFDYVPPGTFTDQREGFFRYQLSCGGPQEEFRFYVSPGPKADEFTLYRAEFWYLDWFDGANVDATGDAIANEIYEWFDEIGAVDSALTDALD